MRIIKNLIIKNKLKKQLNDIETQLIDNGYYEYQRDLNMMFYSPDDYAKLYEYINIQFGELLNQRQDINSQLRLLSGSNIFKEQSDACSNFEK